jgi:hypothetical protein
MAELYANIGEAKLKADAPSSLLTYGSDFYKNIIIRATGVYIYTTAGHRMLD